MPNNRELHSRIPEPSVNLEFPFYPTFPYASMWNITFQLQFKEQSSLCTAHMRARAYVTASPSSLVIIPTIQTLFLLKRVLWRRCNITRFRRPLNQTKMTRKITVTIYNTYLGGTRLE
jgi:hypothetical protein